MMKPILLPCLAAAIAALAFTAPPALTPAAAQINLNMSIGTPPPPPRYEVVPPPRHGYTWAPGYWRWEHDRHVWSEGHWMEAREGHRWEPDHWVRHENGWSHNPGHWER